MSNRACICTHLYPFAHMQHTKCIKTVRSSLILNKAHQLFKSNNAVSNQIVQIVPSYPSCPSIAAGTMLGICVIPVVVLYYSIHVCCSVECSVACCTIHITTIAILTLPRTKLVAHQLTQLQPNTLNYSLIPRGLVVHQGIPKV